MDVRRLIPAELRLSAKLISRGLKDYASSNGKFAKTKDRTSKFSHSISLTQPIKPGTYFDNKVHNIRTGISRIENLVVEPGEVCSFWKLVGKPAERNGFKVGRNIIGGTVREDYGGGLCQLASIMYHLSLIAGLTILERHSHSVDIYKEEDRFTPLGADAAIVYGYKDLRVKNTTKTPIRLLFTIENNELTFIIQSREKIYEADVRFERKYQDKTVTITTIIKNELQTERVLHTVIYKLPE